MRQPFWGPGADYEEVDCENNVLLSILPLQNRPRGLRSICVEVAHKVEHPHMLGRASAAFSEAGADAGPAKRERNVLSCSLPLQNDARDRDSVSVQVARPVSLYTVMSDRSSHRSSSLQHARVGCMYTPRNHPRLRLGASGASAPPPSSRLGHQRMPGRARDQRVSRRSARSAAAQRPVAQPSAQPGPPVAAPSACAPPPARARCRRGEE